MPTAMVQSVGKGRLFKMDLQEEGCGGMDWTELAQVGTGGGDL